jgi:long-chain fatty acid transport protein
MKRGAAALLAGSLVLAPAALAAQGFSVNEHGTCHMGRGGAGVAAPCADGSAVMFNPAGVGVHGRGLLLTAGMTVIAAGGDFTDDYTQASTDLDNDPIPVPHLYVAYGVNEKLAAGLGVFVPYGLGTEWPTTFEGRFSGYDNSLRSIYVQPTVAYEISPGVKLGAGFDYVFGTVKLTQRLDLSEQLAPPPAPPGTRLSQLGIPWHTDFANALIEADGSGFGGNVGVLLDVTDRIHFGARYLTQVTIDYDGTATFDPVDPGIILPADNPFGVPAGTPLSAVISGLNLFSDGGPLADQGGSASITMPAQLLAGLAVDVSSQLRVLADYQFTWWSVFDTLELDFASDLTPDRTIIEAYEDTHAGRVGFEYRSSDRLTLRGGYLYHTAAAPDLTVTPLLPEGARNEFTAGVGFSLGPKITSDVAYQYIRQNNRRGRVQEPPSDVEPTTDLNTGLYSFMAHLLGVTFTVRF